MFGKNYDWSLCVAKNMYKIFGGNVVVVAFQCFFTWKNIKIIFLISVYQNDLKTPKIYQFEAKKK